jgi:hypothetical protein
MRIGINMLVAFKGEKPVIVTRGKNSRDGLSWYSNLRAAKVGIDHSSYLHHDFTNFILSLSTGGKLDVLRIRKFRANDGRDKKGQTVAGIVDPYKLYNIERSLPVFVVFWKDNAGRRLLLTVGSRSIEEFRAVGHDMYQHSEVPLLIAVKNGKFVQINLTEEGTK